jgi:hypothetical protein
MDDHHERGSDTIGRLEAIPAGMKTMAMLILPNDLGSQRTIL